jgi:large subunit ribosomal protein L22
VWKEHFQMEVQAITKNVRIAPRKAWEVMRRISGLGVEEAQSLLSFIPRKAARLVARTLKSAVANAEDQARSSKIHLNSAELRVKRAEVGQGITIKRISARARGSASVIRKRTSHLKVVVSDETRAKPAKAQAPEKKKVKASKK